MDAVTQTVKTSRVGKRPVELPKGVSASLDAAKGIVVKGPKGELARKLMPEVKISVDGTAVSVTSSASGRDASRIQGLYRALIASMVKGVAEGYTRELELRGTGYRVELKGNVLHFALGLSHPVALDLPKGITATVPAESKGTLLILTGAD